MENDTRDFHLGDILSITTERLLSLDHIGGVYNILNWMTGENLMTHQLPRVSDECKGPLLEQHPELADVEVPSISSEAEVITFLASLYPKFGERLPVRRLSAEDHTSIDPIAEVKMMRPDMPIIIFGRDA